LPSDGRPLSTLPDVRAAVLACPLVHDVLHVLTEPDVDFGLLVNESVGPAATERAARDDRVLHREDQGAVALAPIRDFQVAGPFSVFVHGGDPWLHTGSRHVPHEHLPQHVRRRSFFAVLQVTLRGEIDEDGLARSDRPNNLRGQFLLRHGVTVLELAVDGGEQVAVAAVGEAGVLIGSVRS